MRTNIVLDDELVKAAFKVSKLRTKRELVDRALREFVAHHGRLDVRELRGKVTIRADYDHKKLRAGEA